MRDRGFLLSPGGGQVDAYVDNAAVVAFLIRQLGLKQLEIGGPVSQQGSQLCMGVRKDWPEFVTILNMALNSLTPEVRTDIHRQWIDINFRRGIDGNLVWVNQAVERITGFSADQCLAMTANAMAGDREKALASGMNDHVAKPINVQELLGALRKWIKKSGKAQGRKPAPEMETGPGEPAKDAEKQLGRLPGINVRDGLARLGGDVDLYRELLRKFAGNQAETAREIAAALDAGDMETAQRLAHTIKGVAGNIGAQSLFETASRLDKALKDASAETARQLLPGFFHQNVADATDRRMAIHIRSWPTGFKNRHINLLKGEQVIKLLVTYFSQSGNTKKIAQAIFQEAACAGDADLKKLGLDDEKWDAMVKQMTGRPNQEDVDDAKAFVRQLMA